MTRIMMISLALFVSILLVSFESSADLSQNLEKLKSQLASEKRPQEIERLKREISRTEDNLCIQEAYFEKDKNKSKALLSECAEKGRIESEALRKASEERNEQEQEQKDNEEATYEKSKLDYISSRMKVIARDKTLVAIKPGSKLCAFPDSGGSYLLVEDVDKNKVHAVKEYGRPLRPTHKVVVRKHPKFDGKLELEFLEHGLGELLLEELKTVRFAVERCRF